MPRGSSTGSGNGTESAWRGLQYPVTAKVPITVSFVRDVKLDTALKQMRIG